MEIQYVNRIKVKDPNSGEGVQVTIVNQNPQLARTARLERNVKTFLPQLIYLWLQIEQATKYQWKCTSYIRQSPSHQHGIALDIAPDIDPGSQSEYAVYNNSDPVLYKRLKLMRVLQSVAQNLEWPFSTQAIIAVEPDHLHLHILTEVDPSLSSPVRLVKWKVPKENYPDTRERMELDMI